jgi:hypothetical protein
MGRVLAVVGLMVVVLVGSARSQAFLDNCIGLEGVIGSEAQLAFGKAGQLQYTNKNSPDFFVLNVIEYSLTSNFSDLFELDRGALSALEVPLTLILKAKLTH